jgi:hypothetical protein
MNWNPRWIGLGLLFGATSGFAEQNLEVYAGRMEASMKYRIEHPYTNKWISEYVPIYDGYYDGGVAYNAMGEYFKAQASLGMGIYHEKPTLSGSFTMGPKYSVFPKLLDLHVGAGMGYFAYWEKDSWGKEEFYCRTPIVIEAEGVVFDRVSLGYSHVVMLKDGQGAAILKWKLKLGVRVVQW